MKIFLVSIYINLQSNNELKLLNLLQQKKAKAAEKADAEDEWVEDADGNFVKRGD